MSFLLAAVAGQAGAGFAYTTTGSPALTTHGIYSALSWTGSGTFTLVSNPDTLTFDVWIVAGGGAGGADGTGNGNGGGGAGGGLAYTGQTVAIAAHTVTVGGGGAAGGTNSVGANGSDSVFGSLSNKGGGGGAYWGSAAAGSDGGSGGGGGSQKTGYSHAGGIRDPIGSGTGTDGGGGNNLATTVYHGGGGGGRDKFGGYLNDPNGAWAGGVGTTNFYRDGDTGGTTNGTHRFSGGGGSSGVTVSWGTSRMSLGGSWVDGYTQVGTGSSGDSNQSYGAGNGSSTGTGGAGGTNTGGGGGGAYKSGSTAGAGGSGIVVLRWVTP
jgi:hypothetical protein